MRSCPIIAVCLLCACASPPPTPEVLALARLAPLPAGAQEVQVRTLGNLFSRSGWVRFEASSDAIETFLAASPGLAAVRPQRLCDPASQTLPVELPPDTAAVFVDAGSGRCTPRLLQLPPGGSAFDPRGVQAGRLFEVAQDAQADGGRVLVDDASHTVYVWASHS
ncbi:hypothetical protein FGE12_21125 [Aggregicoccus sp. 17bor-14]|uniref:hypothetical protein n=1 Tax=Myxococcaceae TaxID=31 RepID=UPI00129C605F|nr:MULTISPECIES: hypothetical protein [Myxococcaceae]MBF5044917.1 hypothetical protein [Simulacricoccus sp. 17bor-14]MRI90660.1 hypothetical protein [Aggregicoccus sp. 17bor-14]